MLRELEADAGVVALASRAEDMSAPQMAAGLKQGRFTSVQLAKACLLNCLRADLADNSGGPREDACCRAAPRLPLCSLAR